MRIVETATISGQKRSMSGYAIYEFHASVMSAVYGYGTTTNIAATLALTVHAAQEAARNLG